MENKIEMSSLYGKVEKMKKVIRVYAIQLKWFDKVNGNTYTNCIGKGFVNGKEIYQETGFSYGYGSQGFYELEKMLQDMYHNYEIKIVRMADVWTTKQKAKNGDCF